MSAFFVDLHARIRCGNCTASILSPDMATNIQEDGMDRNLSNQLNSPQMMSFMYGAMKANPEPTATLMIRTQLSETVIKHCNSSIYICGKIYIIILLF